MTKTSFYCDKCNRQVDNVDLFGAYLKIKTERGFITCSNRAEKFIDRWCMDEMLLCSDCTHHLIDHLIEHEG